MNKIFVAISFCYLTLSVSCVFAQKGLTFGKVSLDEVKMKTYAPDSTAGAVILCDVGKFNSNTFEFTRHIRIKILNKSGLDFGNWTFDTPTKGYFKILVSNLEGNEIIKEKATNNSIYTEEIMDGFFIYKVFAPGVRVGSVIDIHFSFLGMPFEWRFQQMIPVVYNSLTLEPSQYVHFNKSSMGFEPIKTISDYQWIATDMPAFKIENFLSHYSNYITKFNIQLISITVPGRLHREFCTTWRKAIDYLLDHPRFGLVKTNSGFLNDFANELKNKNLTVGEKAVEAYQYIQKNIKWSGVKSIYASTEFRKNFLTDHVGNSADINLLLCALLEKAGVPAYPVVLSTRENGMLVRFAPSIDKLNYVVAMVEDGNSRVILDATAEDLVPGIIPSFCLNGDGLLVKRDNEQWINLNKNNTFNKRQFFTVSINPESGSKVKISQEFTGYAFVDWIEKLKVNNLDNEIQKNMIQKQFPETKILSYEIQAKDKTASKSTEVIEFDISDNIIDTGEELIFNPLMFLDYAQNPFKSSDRKYPVDLTYPKEYNSTVIISVPSGYSVTKLPESVKLVSSDGAVNFTLLAKNTGTTIQIKAILKFTKHIFSESEYSDVRNLYGEISRIVTTPVELTKTPSK